MTPDFQVKVTGEARKYLQLSKIAGLSHDSRRCARTVHVSPSCPFSHYPMPMTHAQLLAALCRVSLRWHADIGL